MTDVAPVRGLAVSWDMAVCWDMGEHMRWSPRITVASVVVLAVVSVLAALSPASAAREGTHAQAGRSAAATFSPWSGSINIVWVATYDMCDGCIEDYRRDSGTLRYELVSGVQSSSRPTTGMYTARGTGSGTIYEFMRSALGTDECTTTWDASQVETSNLYLGINKPVIQTPIYIWAPVTSTDCSFAADEVTVGGFPSSGIGDTTNEPDPFALRAIVDTNPAPDRLVGTTTFVDTLPARTYGLISYQYTVTYDLTRDNRLPTKLTLGVATAGACGPSGCRTTSAVVGGGLTPKIARAKITVRLDLFRAGRWRTRATKQTLTAATGKYRVDFGAQPGPKCRLVAKFPGDQRHRPSAASMIFAC